MPDSGRCRTSPTISGTSRRSTALGPAPSSGSRQHVLPDTPHHRSGADPGRTAMRRCRTRARSHPEQRAEGRRLELAVPEGDAIEPAQMSQPGPAPPALLGPSVPVLSAAAPWRRACEQTAMPASRPASDVVTSSHRRARRDCDISACSGPMRYPAARSCGRSGPPGRRWCVGTWPPIGVRWGQEAHGVPMAKP